MALCWEQRGCDEEMSSTCPHATASDDLVCVADCYYAQCSNPQRKVTSNIDLVLDPTVDRRAAIKELCRHCEFFLKQGPRLEPGKLGTYPSGQ
ncbi:MAG: hypothetical protein LBS98_07070 [Coriobacteriales bacterium]|jgi:hypothetical protein|nr:hypothetical protein [Coriobacteriales bacterium]